MRRQRVEGMLPGRWAFYALRQPAGKISSQPFRAKEARPSRRPGQCCAVVLASDPAWCYTFYALIVWIQRLDGWSAIQEKPARLLPEYCAARQVLT